MSLPTDTRQWILTKKPTATVEPSSTFTLKRSPLPGLKESQVLLQTLYLSNDPAQRAWIDANASEERMYVPPVKLNTPMRAYGIAKVLESTGKLQKGALVSTGLGWCEYAVADEKDCLPLQSIEGVAPTHFLGALGATGLTAFYGLEVVRAAAGDTVVVSGAAGATGSMAVQIAKKMLGCKRVVGIAGSDEKCEWVKSLGADACVNYRKSSFKDDLKAATEGDVDVYYDNVGGDILDLMLGRMKRHGRIAACGAISGYNGGDKGLKSWAEIIIMRLEIRGFIILDALPRFGEITMTLVQALKEGKLKIDDSNETVVSSGFEGIPEVWMKLFSGANTGKLVTKLETSESKL